MALLVVLGIVLFGGNGSDGDTAANASFITTSDGAADAAPQTTISIRRGISAEWPNPSSWARQTCSDKGYQAVTSLETSKSKVAICADSDLNYYYSGLGRSNGETMDLDANYSKAARQFTAVYSRSGHPSTTYTVTPYSLMIMTNGHLDSYERATSSENDESTSSDETDLLARMSSLLEASSSARESLGDFVSGTFAGNQCMPTEQASQTISDIEQNRENMTDDAEQLQSDAEGTSVSAAADAFVDAMNASKAVDDDLADWVNDYWSDYVDGGCSGTVTQPDTIPGFSDANSQADAAKKTVVQEFNNLAAGTDLKHDWDAKDI